MGQRKKKNVKQKKSLGGFAFEGLKQSSMSCLPIPRRKKKSNKRQKMRESVLYKKHQAVKVGEMCRFTIEYTPKDEDFLSQQTPDKLYLRIKNLEAVPLRAAFLMGPFILYVDVRPAEFDHNRNCFITAEQPVFEPNLQAGQSFYSELSMHTIKKKYVWIVEVASQILFTDSTAVNFDVVIATDKEMLEKTHGLVDDGNFSPGELSVRVQDTVDLWNTPAPDMEKPIHLVLLTHGLYSNVGADMYIIKQAIDEKALKTGENILVKGYQENVCKTEKGVKFLGKGVAEYVINDLMKEYSNIKKISFIGHSLGGLIQTYAIAYLQKHYPDFFDKVIPDKFITMAAPLLGVANENPLYVKFSLTVGVVGRTGQDLGLFGSTPLLLKLPGEPTHQILKRFNKRTVYANTLHDGIVPLRTSALLYLDWKGLSEVTYARKHEQEQGQVEDSKPAAEGAGGVESLDKGVSEIPNTYGDNPENMDTIPYLTSKVLSPLQAMLSLCAPMVKQEHEISKYKRYQTIREDNNEDSGPVKFKSIPKSSMIQSATKVLLPPLPSKKFICDPAARENVILHDKVYTEADLPPLTLDKSTSILSTLNPDRRYHKLEEEIARLWHKDMSWRKVLVNLKPDAHNNIIVRRRFANAYGWGVVDHLVESHFSEVSDFAAPSPVEIDKIYEASDATKVGDDDLDWIKDENENGENPYNKNAEESKKLDYDDFDQEGDLANEMIMSGYHQ